MEELEDYRRKIANLTGQDRANFKAMHFAEMYGGFTKGRINAIMSAPTGFGKTSALPVNLGLGGQSICMEMDSDYIIKLFDPKPNRKLLLICGI